MPSQEWVRPRALLATFGRGFLALLVGLVFARPSPAGALSSVRVGAVPESE